LVPSGKTGIEAFAVIRAAMAKKNMIAIGRLVMSTRERICALEPRDDEILLTTLRTHEEVRQLSAVGPLDLPKPDPRMLEIAEKIVEQQRGTFDPTRFVDRYETALREVIERKRKGQPLAVSAPPADDNRVVDLMEALKKSLGAGVSGELKAANRNKPAASKPAGRKARGSKRAA
jgi:DNA end-binding protein Ku